MIWYICLAVTAFLLLLAMRLLFKKRKGMRQYLAVLLCCVVGAYVIYMPMFFLEYDPVAALLGSLINVFKVFSQETDYFEYCQLISRQFDSAVLTRAYELVLAGVHFMLPVVSAMTAVTVVLQCLGQIRLWFLRRSGREMHVFSCVNDQSEMLATDIRRRAPLSELLFLEENSDLDHTGLRYRLNCKLLDVKIENVRALAKKRKVYYYCIDADEEKNLSSALALLEGLQAETPQAQKNNRIYLFSRDPLAEDMVDALDKGLVDIDVINRHQAAVYRLLEQHPLTDAVKQGDLRVLLRGFGPVNREALRAVCWMGQLADTRLQIDVVADDLSEDEIADFQAAYPGLFTDRYHIRFHSCANRQQEAQVLLTHCRQAGYIIVEGQTEAKTVEQAVYLRRFFYRQDPMFACCPRIFAYLENDDKAGAVGKLRTAELKPERRVSYGITPFGMTSQMLTFDNVTDADIDKLAKNVHLVYEDIFSQGQIDVQAALERYNLFEVNKRSNRANAMHIRSKLAMLGLDYTDQQTGQTAQLQAYLTPEALEKLTYLEHDRWMAFLESEGWSSADIEQVKAYQRSGISRDRHNCPLLKLHPYICAFEELLDRAGQLQLPDPIVYDRELIRRIPDILQDKWGVTGLSCRIIKKQ